MGDIFPLDIIGEISYSVDLKTYSSILRSSKTIYGVLFPRLNWNVKNTPFHRMAKTDCGIITVDGLETRGMLEGPIELTISLTWNKMLTKIVTVAWNGNELLRIKDLTANYLRCEEKSRNFSLTIANLSPHDQWRFFAKYVNTIRHDLIRFARIFSIHRDQKECWQGNELCIINLIAEAVKDN